MENNLFDDSPFNYFSTSVIFWRLIAVQTINKAFAADNPQEYREYNKEFSGTV